MNRRGFLGALFGAAVAPALPKPAGRTITVRRPMRFHIRRVQQYDPIEDRTHVRYDLLHGELAWPNADAIAIVRIAA